MSVEQGDELVKIALESRLDDELLAAVQNLRKFCLERSSNAETAGAEREFPINTYNELSLFLKKKFEETSDPALRLEIASFLACFSQYSLTTPEFYQVLVTALSSASRNTILEDLIDVLLRATANPLKRLNHGLIDAGVVSAILRHIRNLDDNLRVKTCLLIARLYLWCKLDAVQPPSISGVLPFVLESFNSNNDALIASGAEALRSFTGYCESQIDEIFERDQTLSLRLSSLLLSHVEEVIHPVVVTIANIIEESPRRLQTLINAGIIPNLLWLLDHPNKRIVQEVCGCIAQITEKSQEHFQTVIEAAILPKLLPLLQSKEADIGLRYNIASVLNCILSQGSDVQRDYLINEGTILAICKVWSFIDSDPTNRRALSVLRTTYSCLLEIVKIFQEGDESKRERIRIQFQAYQGDLIKKLQNIKELNVFIKDDVVIRFLQSLF